MSQINPLRAAEQVVKIEKPNPDPPEAENLKRN
jgi:hypothetical protein